MGKASKFQAVLIYLFILSLVKKYSEVLYLLQTLVEKLRFNRSCSQKHILSAISLPAEEKLKV